MIVRACVCVCVCVCVCFSVEEKEGRLVKTVMADRGGQLHTQSPLGSRIIIVIVIIITVIITVVIVVVIRLCTKGVALLQVLVEEPNLLHIQIRACMKEVGVEVHGAA